MAQNKAVVNLHMEKWPHALQLGRHIRLRVRQCSVILDTWKEGQTPLQRSCVFIDGPVTVLANQTSTVSMGRWTALANHCLFFHHIQPPSVSRWCTFKTLLRTFYISGCVTRSSRVSSALTNSSRSKLLRILSSRSHTSLSVRFPESSTAPKILPCSSGG